jgi:flagellar assembly factor FliW
VTLALLETRMPQLTFAGGLAGFADHERFALVEVEGGSPLFRLCSLDVPGPEFVVAPPALFFPDYAPEIDDTSAARLGLDDPDDALLLVILTLGARASDATANLLAPIVLNRQDGRAAQVVLSGDHSLQAPLTPYR